MGAATAELAPPSALEPEFVPAAPEIAEPLTASAMGAEAQTPAAPIEAEVIAVQPENPPPAAAAAAEVAVAATTTLSDEEFIRKNQDMLLSWNGTTMPLKDALLACSALRKMSPGLIRQAATHYAAKEQPQPNEAQKEEAKRTQPKKTEAKTGPKPEKTETDREAALAAAMATVAKKSGQTPEATTTASAVKDETQTLQQASQAEAKQPETAAAKPEQSQPEAAVAAQQTTAAREIAAPLPAIQEIRAADAAQPSVAIETAPAPPVVATTETPYAPMDIIARQQLVETATALPIIAEFQAYHAEIPLPNLDWPEQSAENNNPTTVDVLEHTLGQAAEQASEWSLLEMAEFEPLPEISLPVPRLPETSAASLHASAEDDSLAIPRLELPADLEAVTAETNAFAAWVEVQLNPQPLNEAGTVQADVRLDEPAVLSEAGAAVLAQPAPSLEVIADHEPDQPLETTLLQVVVSVKANTLPAAEQAELIKTLDQLSIFLNPEATPAGVATATAEQPVITTKEAARHIAGLLELPEVEAETVFAEVQELLPHLPPVAVVRVVELLAKLGYTNPASVLRQFQAQHGEEFLPAGVLYLRRLLHEAAHQSLVRRFARLQQFGRDVREMLARLGATVMQLLEEAAEQVRPMFGLQPVLEFRPA